MSASEDGLEVCAATKEQRRKERRKSLIVIVDPGGRSLASCRLYRQLQRRTKFLMKSCYVSNQLARNSSAFRMPSSSGCSVSITILGSVMVSKRALTSRYSWKFRLPAG